MSDSLKDQLLALGLADGKRAGKKSMEISLDEAWRRKARTEKQAAEDKRRKKREADLLRRQVNAQIQPIVEKHKLNDSKADLKRNFLYKGRIRSVLVTKQQLKALNEGQLGLAFLRGSYYLLEPEIVARVRAISPDHVPDLADDGDGGAEEEHPVPDDLVW